jgi:hypothetical protein
MIENAESSYRGIHVSRCAQTEKKEAPQERLTWLSRMGAASFPLKNNQYPNTAYPSAACVALLIASISSRVSAGGAIYPTSMNE